MRPGKKCPFCKVDINHLAQITDEQGDLLCPECKGIIFPATNEAEKIYSAALPIPDQYNNACKVIDLHPVSL